MKAEDYQDIGLYLKDSRESLKLSVAEAAHAMNMRVHYVEAIERGNLNTLPGKTYIRGYIRNYALYLGLDPTEVLSVYDVLSVATKQELYIPEPTVQENLPSRALMLIVLLVALSGAAYYMTMGRDTRIAAAQVPEVPPELLLKANAINNPRNFEWMECLSAKGSMCFYSKYSNDVLAPVEGKYGKTFHSVATP